MNTAVDIAPPRPTSEINLPDTKVSAREAFGLDIDMEVPAFSRSHGACSGHRHGL